MELEQLLSFFQATLVPVVMISGIGLVTLIIQTRYSRVVDSSRRLNQERLQLIKKIAGLKTNRDKKLLKNRLDDIEIQIGILVKRGQVLKYSLFSTFLAIFDFILTSFLIIIQVFTNFMIVDIIAITFIIGMFLVLIGILLGVFDIRYSYDAVVVDLETRIK